MIGVFKGVTPYIIKPKKSVEVPRPDNAIFKLHYKVTFVILMASTALVSSYSYIDKSDSSIQCMIDKGTGIKPEVVNRYCWIMNTFTLPKHFNGTIGTDFLHHGVGPMKESDERIYHAYYQWVPFVLAFQAILFYAPHWIWKILEGGRMERIISGLNLTIDNEEDREKSVNQLSGYFLERVKNFRSEHQVWALKFFFCELLNLINVLAQIKFTDVFLGGAFTKFGTEVLHFSEMEPETRVDPMSRVFPRMTKCIFHKYGGSGTIQRFDALCVLSMNIVNEKIYIFLWFWFILLATVTAIHLIVRAMQFFMPDIRQRMVLLENLGYTSKRIRRSDVENVVQRLNYSDWLILYYLARAMEHQNFGDLLKKLYVELTGDDNEEEQLDEDKRVTPPPDFDDIEKHMRETDTLKSPSKLKSMLSFRKEKN